MQNTRPIFVNGLSRGGTNILTNLLLSHPSVCMPTGEMHKVFKGRAQGEGVLQTIRKRVLNDLAVIVGTGQDVFDPFLLQPRRTPSRWVRRHIDRTLFSEKLRACHESHNLYVTEGIRYTRDGIRSARLLCKGLNGLVFTTAFLHEMYPDAVFFGIVRNGLAVCEGHIRRGRSVDEVARLYQTVAMAIHDCARQYGNYHLVRFEDILADPVSMMRELYAQAGLDLGQVQKVRLQLKPTLNEKGEHRLEQGYDRQLVWYDIAAVGSHFENDIDDRQIRRLSMAQRQRFIEIAGDAMRRLGYPIRCTAPPDDA